MRIFDHTRDTFYHIIVRRAGVDAARPADVTVDGQAQPGPAIRLVDDRQEHTVEVRIRDAIAA